MYKQFLQKAQNDLLNIENNFSSEKIPVDTCCFHAQQAAEKCLKAYLDYHKVVIPKIHNLLELLDLCLPFNPDFTHLKTVLRALNNYSVTPRYPDELVELTFEDAKEAYQAALQVKTFIEDHFFR